jgi:DNA polymerase-3 subunit epsilon
MGYINVTVSGPKPETADDYAFYKFVSQKPNFLLKPWYEALKKQGSYFKPEFEAAINMKLTTDKFSNPIDFKTQYGTKMDYIGIDFETANNSRISACALGLTFIKNDTVIDEDFHYIQPPKGTRFLQRHKDIHGISEEDVEYSFTFQELWEDDLKEFFNNNLLVLHNASMDAAILKQLFEHYDITDHNITYACTLNIAKQLGLPTKLLELCEYYDIKIGNHHDAKEDALMCAQVASSMTKEGINLNQYAKRI